MRIKKSIFKNINLSFIKSILSSDEEFDYFVDFLSNTKVDGFKQEQWESLCHDFHNHQKGSELTDFKEKPEYVDFRKIIKRNIYKFAKHVAVSCLNTTMTYQKLGERTRQICNYLYDQVNAGDVVAIYLPRHIDLVPSLLAVMQLGAAFVLLNDPAKDRNEQRLQYCLKITYKEYCEKKDKKLILLTFNEGSLTSLFLQQEQQKLFNKKIFVEQAESEPDDFIISAPIAADSLAYITFTSGSTGNPKGVLIPYEGIYARVAAHVVLPEHPITDKDIFSQFCPIDVDAAILEILIPLLSGGQLVLTPEDVRENYKKLVEYYTNKKVTASIFAPTVLKDLQSENNIETLKIIFSVGEDVSGELLDHFVSQGKTIVNGYGPSEVTIATSLALYEKTKGVHIGKGMPGVTMELWPAQEKSGEQPGAPFEIVIGGLGVALEYIGASEDDNKRLNRDKRFYRSGDRGEYVDNDKNIRFLGRLKDDQLKLGGRLVRYEEVWDAITPVVTGFATIEKIKSYYGKILVHIRFNEPLDEVAQRKNIFNFASKLKQLNTPISLFPARWGVSQSKNKASDAEVKPVYWKANQSETKLTEEPAQEIYLAQNPEPTQYMKSAELLAIEKQLIDLWGKILLTKNESNTIKADDEFFQIGGDSVDYNRLVTLFERTFSGVSFPREFLINHPSADLTIEFLARHIWRTKIITSKKEEVELTAIKNEVIKTLNDNAKFYDYTSGIQPLFCMHALLGDTSVNYTSLSGIFQDRAVFGLSSWGLPKSGRGLLAGDLQELAYSYIAVIKEIKPQGPYYLLGWSFGGILMHAIAKHLRKQGAQVSVIILDSTCPQALVKMNNTHPNYFADYIRELAAQTWQYNKLPDYQLSEELKLIKDPVNKNEIVIKVFDFLLKQAKIINKETDDIIQSIELAKQNVLAAIGYDENQLHKNDLLFVAKIGTVNGFTETNVKDLGWKVDNTQQVVSIEGNHFAMIISKSKRDWGQLETMCAELEKKLNEKKKSSATFIFQVYDFFRKNKHIWIPLLFISVALLVGYLVIFILPVRTRDKSNDALIIYDSHLENYLNINNETLIGCENETPKVFDVSDLNCIFDTKAKGANLDKLLCVDNTARIAETPICRSDNQISFFDHDDAYKIRFVVGPSVSGKTEMLKGFVKRYYRKVRGEVLVWWSRNPEMLIESVKELFGEFGYKKENIGPQDSITDILRNLNKHLVKYPKIILLFDNVENYTGSKIQEFVEFFNRNKNQQIEVVLISRKLDETTVDYNVIDLSIGLSLGDSIRFLKRLNNDLSLEDARKYVGMLGNNRFPYYIKIIASMVKRYEINALDELHEMILERGRGVDGLIQQQIKELLDDAKEFLKCISVLDEDSISLELLKNFYKKAFDVKGTGKDFRVIIESLQNSFFLQKSKIKTETIYSMPSIVRAYIQASYNNQMEENFSKMVSFILQQFPFPWDTAGRPDAMQARVTLFPHLKAIINFLSTKNIRLSSELNAELHFTLSITYSYFGNVDEVLRYIIVPLRYWRNEKTNEHNLIKVYNLCGYALRYSKNISTPIEQLNDLGFKMEKASGIMANKRLLEEAMEVYKFSSNKKSLTEMSHTWNDYPQVAEMTAETAIMYIKNSIELKKQNLSLYADRLPTNFFNLARWYSITGDTSSTLQCYLAAINSRYNLKKNCIDLRLLFFLSRLGAFKDNIGEKDIGRNILIAVDYILKKIKLNFTEISLLKATHQINYGLFYARNKELSNAIKSLRFATEFFNYDYYPELYECLDCLEKVQNQWGSRSSFWYPKEEVTSCLLILAPSSTSNSALQLANVIEDNPCDEYAQNDIDPAIIKECIAPHLS